MLHEVDSNVDYRNYIRMVTLSGFGEHRLDGQLVVFDHNHNHVFYDLSVTSSEKPVSFRAHKIHERKIPKEYFRSVVEELCGEEGALVVEGLERFPLSENQKLDLCALLLIGMVEIWF